MKYHVRLCIMMPRLHNHDQEGWTRCASICGRYSNGGRYWHCWALELCSSSSRRVSGTGVGSKLMLASSRAVEFSTGSLPSWVFGLTFVHPVVHVCIHDLAQRAEFAKTRYATVYHIHQMFSTCFKTHTSQVLAHYAHQSLYSAAQMYTVPHLVTHPNTYHHDCGLWFWGIFFEK